MFFQTEAVCYVKICLCMNFIVILSHIVRIIKNPMNPIKSTADAVISCFSKYACFRGCASRSEFWLFCLFNVLVSTFLFLSGCLTTYIGQGDPVFLWILSGFYALAVVPPTLAAGIRRLHDTGRSGYNMLWMLLPVIGGIILIVYLAQPPHSDL